MPIISKMTESDLDQVAEIASLSFARPWSRQGFADALPMDNACFLVARKDKMVVGYGGLSMALDEGEIVSIAVKPDYKRQGIADKLIGRLLEAGRRSGVSRFFLEVRVTNAAAIRLYEKHGFSICGIRKNYYTEIHEDAYVMHCIDEE